MSEGELNTDALRKHVEESSKKKPTPVTLPGGFKAFKLPHISVARMSRVPGIRDRLIAQGLEVDDPDDLNSAIAFALVICDENGKCIWDAENIDHVRSIAYSDWTIFQIKEEAAEKNA